MDFAPSDRFAKGSPRSFVPILDLVVVLKNKDENGSFASVRAIYLSKMHLNLLLVRCLDPFGL